MTETTLARTAARMGAATSLLLVIDVQEKLCPVMDDPRRVLANSLRLMRAAARLEVPCVVTEQYPQGLGPTMIDLREAMPPGVMLEKRTFCATEDPDIRARLDLSGRRQAVLCGIEMHVCVLQTALGLRGLGWDVFVVTDACSSRRPESEVAALVRMQVAGVVPVSTEMVLFEWLHGKDNPAFRAIMEMIR